MAYSTVDLATPEMDVTRIPCLSDNYAWLLYEPTTKKTAVVDPSESGPVDSVLEEKGWQLNYILNTHHHFDHTGGNLQLKKKHECMIVGPEADRDRIPGIDVALKDGDEWMFGELMMKVYDTPGHTRGHITLYFPGAASLFPGDTLFLMGCGRLFEGTPEQMFNSLGKMKVLPGNTRVYCAHEYTQNNARWAVTEEPKNEALISRKQEVEATRQKGAPTVPALLEDELATNPFLRATSVEAFAKLRHSKDNF